MIEEQVVNGIEAGAEDFAAFIQVAQIGTAVMAAGIAAAIRLDRAGVEPICRVTDIQGTGTREQMAPWSNSNLQRGFIADGLGPSTPRALLCNAARSEHTRTSTDSTGANRSHEHAHTDARALALPAHAV